jgi:hypothetical protein
VRNIAYVPIGRRAVAIGQRIFWIEADGRLRIGKRLLGLAERTIGIAAKVVGKRVVRVELERLSKFRKGLVPLQLAAVDIAAPHIGLGISGVQAEDGVKVGEGLVGGVHQQMDPAAGNQGRLESRIEFEGVIEVGECLLGFAAIGQGPTSTGIGVEIIGHELDCLVEIGDRFGISAGPVAGIGTPEVGGAEIGVGGDGGREFGNSLLIFRVIERLMATGEGSNRWRPSSFSLKGRVIGLFLAGRKNGGEADADGEDQKSKMFHHDKTCYPFKLWDSRL